MIHKPTLSNLGTKEGKKKKEIKITTTTAYIAEHKPKRIVILFMTSLALLFHAMEEGRLQIAMPSKHP